jgi:hypothetical protein
MPEPHPTRPADPTARAAEVAAAVLTHPGVVRLDGGPFGTVASHLPGRRRILGVRIGVDDEPVELAVVARLGTPLPLLADELGTAVRTLLGPVAVEVTVSDVAPVAVPVRTGGDVREVGPRRT